MLPYILMGTGSALLLFFRKRNDWKRVPNAKNVPKPDGGDPGAFDPSDGPNFSNYDPGKNFQPPLSSYHGRDLWFQ